MDSADLEALPLFAAALGIAPPGCHFRDPGRKCPRGHDGPFRDVDGYCVLCRRLEAPSWKIARRTGHAVAKGIRIPTECVHVMGASDEKIRAFLLEGCQRLGLDPKDYGKTWGIYRVRQLRHFDLSTQAGFLAANRLENLRVDRLHTRPHR